MTKDELMSNCNLLVPAGSESTMEVMVSTLYLLLSSPEVLKDLVDMVRKTFKTPDDITFESTEKLKFLEACINESMRFHPPVPIRNPRGGPESGTMVQGIWITSNVSSPLWLSHSLPFWHLTAVMS
jgi:cytochrome P450